MRPQTGNVADRTNVNSSVEEAVTATVPVFTNGTTAVLSKFGKDGIRKGGCSCGTAIVCAMAPEPPKALLAAFLGMLLLCGCQ